MADSEHESSILYWDSCAVLKYLITIIDVVVLPYLVHTSATYSSSSSISAAVTSSLCVNVRPDYSMYTCSTAVTPLSYQHLECVSTS